MINGSSNKKKLALVKDYKFQKGKNKDVINESENKYSTLDGEKQGHKAKHEI